ncbi:MAG: hypothetical protein WBY93_02910 [Candidatus Binatus sp.]
MATGPVYADCQFGQDYPTDLRCFLNQFGGSQCYDSYFGFSGPPNFSEALQCFENNKIWSYLVVMYLNGQGGPRDVQKAEQWFATGQKMAPIEWPGGLSGGEVSSLKQNIEKARSTSDKDWDPIDLCSDVFVLDTRETQYCTAIRELVSERQFSEMLASTRTELDSADKSIFDRVIASFKAYQEADTKRAYLAWAGGTIASMRSMDQAGFLRDDFAALVKKTVQKRELEPADKIAYSAADQVLNQTYREDLQGGSSEYKKSARIAELHWIRYRDGWAELATALFSDRKKDPDPAMSMKTALSKVRVNELLHARQP